LIDRSKGAIAVVSKAWDRGVEAPLRWRRRRLGDPSALRKTRAASTFSLDLASQRLFHSCTRHGRPNRPGGRCRGLIRDEMSRPPAVYAKRGDGAERKVESFKRTRWLRRFQLGASERSLARLGRRSGADVAGVPAALRTRRRSTRCCH